MYLTLFSSSSTSSILKKLLKHSIGSQVIQICSLRIESALSSTFIRRVLDINPSNVLLQSCLADAQGFGSSRLGSIWGCFSMTGDVEEPDDRFFSESREVIFSKQPDFVNIWIQAGEVAMDQEDKMVVPPRKKPEVENKQKKTEHEPESEFVEEKESKGREQKAFKKIEMANAAYKAFSTMEIDDEDNSLS